MFSEILVPSDFSEHAAAALRLAVRLAQASQGRITLLHVGLAPGRGMYDLGSYGAPFPDTLVRLHEEAARQQQQALERLARAEIPAEVPWRAISREGSPAPEIAAEADAGGHDLIVMGTHGRTGLERAFLGSVTERVLRTSRVPILVTR